MTNIMHTGGQNANLPARPCILRVWEGYIPTTVREYNDKEIKNKRRLYSPGPRRFGIERNRFMKKNTLKQTVFRLMFDLIHIQINLMKIFELES
jgi:hypothetical protein